MLKRRQKQPSAMLFRFGVYGDVVVLRAPSLSIILMYSLDMKSAASTFATWKPHASLAAARESERYRQLTVPSAAECGEPVA